MVTSQVLLISAEDAAPGEELRISEAGLARLGARRVSLRDADTTAFVPGVIILEAIRRAGWQRALRTLKRRWESTPVLGAFFESLEAGLELEDLEAAGFADFVCAPVQEAELLLRVKRLLPFAGNATGHDVARFKAQHHLESLLGESEPFFALLRRIPALAAAGAAVLIEGETGTGKELVARALHYSSPRRNGPFVPCNCGAVPDHLLENELFGHTAGAYTDARADQKGLVALAEGGTLFLDEVDSLSLSGQVKLLRFLQDGDYRPLGFADLRRANVRVLAATNVSLADAVAGRTFREDLFHRLNVLRVSVPPLRERAADIPLLAQRFLDRFAREAGSRAVRFSAGAIEVLACQRWPGNVRELESIVQRAAILCSGPVVEACDLDLPHASRAGSAQEFEEAKRTAIESFERGYLTRILSAAAGNVSRAARSAGKDRRNFQRLLRKHNLTPARFLK